MTSQPEQAYLDLLKSLIETGEARAGRNGGTLALFGTQLSFDISESFPLLTTKRVFWRGVIEELLWFLRGSTDANELKAKNVHIWDGNSTREYLDSRGLYYSEGQLGPVYGHQWRNFGGVYAPAFDNSNPMEQSNSKGADQVADVLHQLTTDPMGRRAIISAWNPNQLSRMALPPCHLLYNFFIGKDGLSCQMYQRSADFCAGSPFNIASTAALTCIFAHILGLKPHRIIICMGDTHVYEQHVEGAREQLTRTPLPPPQLAITRPPPPADATLEDKLKWIDTLTFEDFDLKNYTHHPSIKFEMVA